MPSIGADKVHTQDELLRPAERIRAVVAEPHARKSIGKQHKARRSAAAADPDVAASRLLNSVYLGTTGLCNASCIHCPTGKTLTDHAPRTPMPMALFESLMRQLSEGGYTIKGQVSFGLFGDGLVDPYVLERAAIMRDYLPDTFLSVNTNGAAYDRSKHKKLFDYVSVMAIHVESLTSRVYNTLMAPLRFERVMPKIEQILDDFPGKVRVSAPVSKLNLDEFPNIHRYFTERGAQSVNADALASRCVDDRTQFDRLATAPVKHWCEKDAMEQLVVDCDGVVLLCCNDFERREPIGDLSKETLEDLLENERHRQIRALFDPRRLSELKTCEACYMSYSSFHRV